MAEVQPNVSTTQHRRPVRRAVRVDMTPMVDLAFLLLTFFVLTSELVKEKNMVVTFPKESNTTSLINEKGALTLIPDGSGKNIFWYRGKFESNAHLKHTTVSKNDLGRVLAQANQEANVAGKPLFVIIKPSENARYGTVIELIDELHVQGLDRYAITTISPVEASQLKLDGGK